MVAVLAATAIRRVARSAGTSSGSELAPSTRFRPCSFAR